MSESAIAERYARAMFELGLETGKLEQLTSDFRRFYDAFTCSAELRGVLSNPAVSEEQRTSVLRTLASRLAMGTEALNAVRLLTRRRRLAQVPAISRRLGTLADERAGIVRVKVTSAAPLPDTFYAQLAAKIETGLGKKPVIERSTDASLIAGVVTTIGDNTIDGSLKGKLEALEQRLTSSSS